MKTTVALENLRFRALHGVSPQERAVGNDFIVTVRLRYPFQKAMDADTLADTLNYAEAYDIIKAEMAIPSSLIEHVAGRIRSALLARFPLIEGGMVRVEKAKKLLLESSLSIQKVAELVGYRHEKHFMQIFKKACGMTPSQFRFRKKE